MKYSLLILFQFLFFFAPAKNDIPVSIYDVQITDVNGANINFAAYKGKKILIVNTPRNSAYNRQYAELNALYQKYKDKLVIIGFLTDDFAVAPGSKQTDNYNTDYNVSFPLAAKILVRGNNMAPVYKWLTDKQYNNFKSSEVKWDFQKYLINENGQLIAVFDPKVRATNPAIIKAIEE